MERKGYLVKHYFQLSHVTCIYNEKKEPVTTRVDRLYIEGIMLIYLGNPFNLK